MYKSFLPNKESLYGRGFSLSCRLDDPKNVLANESIEEKITSSRDKKSKLDQNIESISEQVRKNEKEIKIINSELNDATFLIENNEKLDAEISQTQVNLDGKINQLDLNK